MIPRGSDPLSKKYRTRMHIIILLTGAIPLQTFQGLSIEIYSSKTKMVTKSPRIESGTSRNARLSCAEFGHKSMHPFSIKEDLSGPKEHIRRAFGWRPFNVEHITILLLS